MSQNKYHESEMAWIHRIVDQYDETPYRILESKTYKDVKVTSTSSGNYYYFTFLRLIPKDLKSVWRIKYRMRVYSQDPNMAYCGDYECEFWGYGRNFSGQKIWNAIKTRPFYYHTVFRNKTDSNVLTQGNFFGIYTNGSELNWANDSYKRTFEIDLEDYYNCTVLFQPAMEALPSTYLEEVPGVCPSSRVALQNYVDISNIGATSTGFNETGDSDTTYYLACLNSYFPLGGTVRLNGYTLCGLNRNNQVISFGAYGTNESTTARTTTQGDRKISSEGIDWTKGIFYSSTSTDYAPGNTVTSTLYKAIHCIDLRYTFNCVASTSTDHTELGLINGKMIYLRGYLTSDGLFHFLPTTVTYSGNTYLKAWTQEVPAYKELWGNCPIVYWQLGYPYYSSSYPQNNYQFTLLVENKLYRGSSAGPQEYIPSAETAVKNTSGDTLLGGEIADDAMIDLLFEEGTNVAAIMVDGRWFNYSYTSDNEYVWTDEFICEAITSTRNPEIGESVMYDETTWIIEDISYVRMGSF